LGCAIGVEQVGCHFWSSPEVKKEIEIFKDYLSNQIPYHIIKSIFDCPKPLTPSVVEASSSGYVKEKFKILNFQCLEYS
jgi:hypothetical protein